MTSPGQNTNLCRRLDPEDAGTHLPTPEEWKAELA